MLRFLPQSIIVIRMSETTSRPVPVVRLIVPGPSGTVLVLQRAANSTDGGRWCLPGGKVDYGDTVEQAAIRELQEETGLRATSLTFLFYQDSLPPAPGRMHCVNLYFECAAEGEVVLNEESTEAAWIGPEDIVRFPLSFRNDEALIRYWQNVEHKEN
jgi:8-oxo-dGTP diphosphatase